MGKFITKDLLKDKMGGQFQLLAMAQIDRGSAFLSGMITSSFVKARSSVLSAASNAASAATDVVSSVAGNVSSIQNAATSAIGSATAAVTNAASGSIGNAASSATSAIGTAVGAAQSIIPSRGTQALAGSTAILGTAAAGASVALNVYQNKDEIISAIAQLPMTLFNITSERLQEEVMKITTDTVQKVTKMVTAIPATIAKITIEKTKENMEPFGDCMARLKKDTPTQIEEKQKENESNKEEEIKNKAKDAQKNIAEKIVKITDQANKYITLAVQYITEGPDMVVTMLNDVINFGVSEAYKFQKEQLNALQIIIDDFCLITGEASGKIAAEQINKVQEKAVKKILQVQEKAKAKLTAKTNMTVQKAKLKIFALLGV